MKNLTIAVVATLSLSACVTINAPMDGTSNNTAIQYPVESALLNIYTQNRTSTLMTMLGNQQISADITVAPKGAVVFDNKRVQSAQIRTISKIDDKVTNQTTSTNYYTLNPLTFHGYTDRSGEYSIATQTATIPKMATAIADKSYPLLTENVYSDSSKSQKTAVYRQSWSLTPDSSNSAWLCINTSENLLLATPVGSTSECYKINTKGQILSSKVSINVPNNNANNSTSTITLVSQ